MTSVLHLLQEMPDARERLAYASRMTEVAAHEVLGIVESAQPECQRMVTQCRDMGAALDRLATSQDLTIDRARSIVRLCSGMVARMGVFAGAQHAALGDIMLRQDFQDLSGQVIGKAVALIQNAEAHLTEVFEAPIGAAVHNGSAAPMLTGPQVPDKALKQGEVDDLMASLGF
ncbi:protein phosphatase CheZ [Roseateles cavernae]|uniref:protein phosphatase CheZ n=1 Tax=Roseateles cavernae TaxID=3153578 RepID=UPI0032E3A3A9